MVESLKFFRRVFVVLKSWSNVDVVFQRKEVPKCKTLLDTTIANVKWNDFSHDAW